MRLTDCYLDLIVLARKTVRVLDHSELNLEKIRDSFVTLAQRGLSSAEKSGYSEETAMAGLFPVIAYIDELVLCSKWEQKSEWQKRSLQRHFYQTTNIGAEFYEQLNNLSKHGEDAEIREVYVLCLGLGFRGRYFANDDRRTLEQIKGFNVGVLMPEEAQRNLETATLFPAAYGSVARDGKGRFKARFNVIPFVLGVPLVLSLALILYYHFGVVDTLNTIARAVK